MKNLFIALLPFTLTLYSCEKASNANTIEKPISPKVELECLERLWGVVINEYQSRGSLQSKKYVFEVEGSMLEFEQAYKLTSFLAIVRPAFGPDSIIFSHKISEKEFDEKLSHFEHDYDGALRRARIFDKGLVIQIKAWFNIAPESDSQTKAIDDEKANEQMLKLYEARYDSICNLLHNR